MSILIVDDEKDLQELIGDVLVSSNVCASDQICYAPNGKIALELVATLKPKVIITDLMMPVMSGSEFIEGVRKVDKECEIIVMTGHADMDLAVKLFKYGVVDFLRKPFNVQELVIIIKNARDRYLLRQENERFKKRLYESEKLSAIGLLAAGVAHEINNPNTFIKGNLELLLMYAQSIEPLLDAQIAQGPSKENDRYKLIKESFVPTVKAALGGSERIKKIVSGILSVGRQSADTAGCVDVLSVIDEALQLSSHKLKKYKVNYIPSQTPVYSLGVYQDILQVILNLLVNAADALDEKFDGKDKSSTSYGHVDITTQVLNEGQIVTLVIEDNAGGIKQELLNKVYDPFFTTKPIGKGTGLGLSISKALIEKSNGELICESKAGVGTKFTINIPLYKKEDADGTSIAC